MRRTLRLSVLLLGFIAAAQQPAVVEITAEPSHHLAMQNDFLRAFNVLAPPKASTLVHKHNFDYLYVTLGDTEITNERTGEKPAQMSLKDGEVRFTKGGFSHAVVNNSDHPFHNITIELLKPATGVQRCEISCDITIPCPSTNAAQCGTWKKVIESDQWVVTSLTLPPGAVAGPHAYAGPYLSVAVSDMDIKRSREDGRSFQLHSAVGDLAWSEPLPLALTNTGSKTAEIVNVEFKNNPGAHP
jgi:quercetin dioxygenase-like cupin family protein